MQGLYRGYSISVFCIPVFNTIFFPCYEMTKAQLRNNYDFKSDDMRLHSISAGIAGALCNVLTNPLWLVRTRMQSEIFKNPSQEHYNKKYSHGSSSIMRNLLKIYNKEGFRALYRGLPASMLGVLHPLVFFPIYEKCKQHFKSQNKNQLHK